MVKWVDGSFGYIWVAAVARLGDVRGLILFVWFNDSQTWRHQVLLLSGMFSISRNSMTLFWDGDSPKGLEADTRLLLWKTTTKIGFLDLEVLWSFLESEVLFSFLFRMKIKTSGVKKGVSVLGTLAESQGLRALALIPREGDGGVGTQATLKRADNFLKVWLIWVNPVTQLGLIKLFQRDCVLVLVP